MQLAVDERMVSTVVNILPAGTCSKSDVVLLKSFIANQEFEAGHVCLHASVLGQLVSLVSVWQLDSYDEAKGCATWRKQDNPMFVCQLMILSPLLLMRLSGMRL